MPLVLPWSEIALRLFCSVIVGAALGLNRSEHGRVAGVRTSILVCLAACLAMLQVNLWLSLAGRPSDSFVMNDLMRLPLGILSGIGFIGAGAIIRRNDVIVGVTTAATIWFLTVVGLCLGGGLIALGLIAGAFALVVLTPFRLLEDRLRQERLGTLVVVFGPAEAGDLEIRSIVEQSGFRIRSCAFATRQGKEAREIRLELRWRAKPADTGIPAFVHNLAGRSEVLSVEWTPTGR
jgi:putative Mg2+ transporter-C (MgtC) family protein